MKSFYHAAAQVIFKTADGSTCFRNQSHICCGDELGVPGGDGRGWNKQKVQPTGRIDAGGQFS
jgi:hypothetical protein